MPMDNDGASSQEWEKFDKISMTSVQIENDDPLSNKKEEPAKQSEKASDEKADEILDPSRLEQAATKKPAKPSIISAPNNVNGKVLATVYPDNMTCDWITPPHYDPYSMPSILAIDVPSLNGEDYINTINKIIKDRRFKMFTVVYSRIIAIWMTLWIGMLALTLLFQSKGGWPVMMWCLVWSLLLFVGIYACAMIRRRIRIGLNKTVAEANAILIDHHFLVGVEDRGQLSCHKVVIHFARFNVAECHSEVVKLLKINKTGGCVFGESNTQDCSNEDYDKEATRLILKYSQEFVKSVVKKRLIFPSKPLHGVSNYTPKHCKNQLCLCQFIDDKRFNAKPKKWYERYV